MGQGGQAQEIVPANLTSVSCPQIGPMALTTPRFYGFSNLSVYNLSKDFVDFVIAPGHTGTIRYIVNRTVVSGTIEGARPNITIVANVTNGMLLSHTSYETVNQTIRPLYMSITKYQNGTVVKYRNSTFAQLMNGTIIIVKKYQNSTVVFNGLAPSQNGTIFIANGSMLTFPNGTKIAFTKNVSNFNILSILPLGKTTIMSYDGCSFNGTFCHRTPESAPHSIRASYTNYSHTGINITFQPWHEVLSLSNFTIVNATISTAANATPGTYLLQTIMSGEYCIGGPFAYLTIGTVPYSGNAPRIGII